jgi:hypothetical protein
MTEIQKSHHNKEWLQQQIDLGKTSKEIAKDNKISYKLVEIYLKKYEIPFVEWAK